MRLVRSLHGVVWHKYWLLVKWHTSTWCNTQPYRRWWMQLWSLRISDCGLHFGYGLRMRRRWRDTLLAVMDCDLWLQLLFGCLCTWPRWQRSNYVRSIYVVRRLVSWSGRLEAFFYAKLNSKIKETKSNCKTKKKKRAENNNIDSNRDLYYTSIDSMFYMCILYSVFGIW